MKKNVLMRAASGLLVATMLTTCAISGTFAKYVTQDNGGDLARVAKWGVVVQVEGDLYGTNYKDAAVNTKTDAAKDISVSGIQIANTNVVAPGTKNEEGFAFNVNGTPEVDSQLTVELTWQNIYLSAGTYGVMVPTDSITEENIEEIAAKGELYTSTDGKTFTKYVAALADVIDIGTASFYTLEDAVTSASDYYPVVYNLTGSTATTFNYSNKLTASTNTLDEIANTIKNAVMAPPSNDTPADAASALLKPEAITGKHISNMKFESAVIDHNRNLTDVFGLGTTKLVWDWEFEDQDVNTNNIEQEHDISVEDKLDTILGNLMAERVVKEGTNVSTTATSSKNFNGVVVKTTDDGATYVLPKEAGTSADGAQDDFCLDTKFEICILAEQVD